MTQDPNIYMYSTYFATGEGMTTCLMITRSNPSSDDYESQPTFEEVDGKMTYVPGVLKNSPEDIAKRHFRDEFGFFYSCDLEVLTKQEFLDKAKSHIPSYVENILNDPEAPGNFYWTSCVHVNYS